MLVRLLSLCILLLGVVPAAAAEAPVRAVEAALAAAVQAVEKGDAATALTTLQSLDPAAVPAALRPQVSLLLGILLVRQGVGAAAVAPLESAAATYPLLADYALWHLAAAYRATGDAAGAAGALRRLLDRHSDSLFTEQAARALPRDWLDAGNLAQAEEAAGQYLKRFSNGPGQAEVWVTLGEVLLRTGRSAQAEELFRRVWIELPGTPQSQQAQEWLTSIPGARAMTPDERYQRAVTLQQAGRYGQAQTEMEPFAAAGDPRETQARLLLGIGAFRLRQYRQAAQWLEPLRASSGAEAAEASFMLARSYGRAGDSVGFVDQMTRLVDTFPGTRWAEEGLYLLAQAAIDAGDPDQAKGYLTRQLAAYPKGSWADDALWLLGWLAYKGRDLDAAVASWDRLLKDEPVSVWKAPALYWRGRALEAAQRKSGAVQAYRTVLTAVPDQTYYWFLARERLARLGKTVPPPPTRTEATELPAATSTGIHAQKARALRALGLTEEAADQYSAQVRGSPEDRTGISEACRGFLDLERFDRAVSLARLILRPWLVQQDGRPPIRGYWQCAYPRAYWPLVQRYAQEEVLDPLLVTALMREESGFAPRIISPAGAKGLMQLMPQTAEQTVRGRSARAVPTAPLEDPEVNIRVGTMHLADLLRDYGGSLRLSLAAYNAGAAQVRRWQERYGFADEEEFTEDIPYTETRNYVKRVLGSYQRYLGLFPRQGAVGRAPGAVAPPTHAAARGGAAKR
jgi:soluble lytic murein transglycosylase